MFLKTNNHWLRNSIASGIEGASRESKGTDNKIPHSLNQM